jgi:hypothetical protein
MEFQNLFMSTKIFFRNIFRMATVKYHVKEKICDVYNAVAFWHPILYEGAVSIVLRSWQWLR